MFILGSETPQADGRALYCQKYTSPGLLPLGLNHALIPPRQTLGWNLHPAGIGTTV
jgi:hypothetical protein